MSSPSEPAKRGRGRPRQIQQIHVDPIARDRPDYRKLAGALLALVQSEARAAEDVKGPTKPERGG